jgi:hypothetical protein
MLQIFLWISTLYFLIMGILWKSSDFLNFLCKAGNILMGIVGIILLLMQYGFLIKG